MKTKDFKKRCPRCAHEKLPIAFGRDNYRPDKRAIYCRVCKSEMNARRSKARMYHPLGCDCPVCQGIWSRGPSRAERYDMKEYVRAKLDALDAERKAARE